MIQFRLIVGRGGPPMIYPFDMPMIHWPHQKTMRCSSCLDQAGMVSVGSRFNTFHSELLNLAILRENDIPIFEIFWQHSWGMSKNVTCTRFLDRSSIRVYFAVNSMGLVLLWRVPCEALARTSLEQCRMEMVGISLPGTGACPRKRGHKNNMRNMFFCAFFHSDFKKTKKISVHIAPRVIEWIPFERPLWRELSV